MIITMNKFLFLVIFLPASFFAGAQSYDRKALDYYYTAMGCTRAKDYTRAIIEFSKAIELDSGFIQAWENRGVAKFYLKDYTGAIEDYNKAIEINPDDYNTFGRRGWTKFYLDDLRGAIDDFTKAIQGNSNDAEFRIGRGEAKFKLKDYNGALVDFNKIVRFAYGDREQRRLSYFWRGFIKIDLGQRTSGCADLKQSSKMGYDKAFEVYDIYCK